MLVISALFSSSSEVKGRVDKFRYEHGSRLAGKNKSEVGKTSYTEWSLKEVGATSINTFVVR